MERSSSDDDKSSSSSEDEATQSKITAQRIATAALLFPDSVVKPTAAGMSSKSAKVAKLSSAATASSSAASTDFKSNKNWEKSKEAKAGQKDFEVSGFFACWRERARERAREMKLNRL